MHWSEWLQTRWHKNDPTPEAAVRGVKEDLGSLNVPLHWPKVKAAMSRHVHAVDLVDHLYSFESYFHANNKKAFQNVSHLATWLFESGFESDTVAWLIYEPRADGRAVENSLEELGVGLLPEPWIRGLEVLTYTGRVLSESMPMGEACGALRDQFLDFESRRTHSWLYEWDELLDGGFYEGAIQLVGEVNTFAAELREQ